MQASVIRLRCVRRDISNQISGRGDRGCSSNYYQVDGYAFCLLFLECANAFQGTTVPGLRHFCLALTRRQKKCGTAVAGGNGVNGHESTALTSLPRRATCRWRKQPDPQKMCEWIFSRRL